MENRLRELRKKKGMTQDQLAQAVGATKRQIGAWERGENELPMDYADAIAELFDCSIDNLAGRIHYAVVRLDDPPLNDDERELVDLFRSLPQKGRHAVLVGLRDFAGRS